MAYTEQDRDRLKAAIASGVLTVEHEGRRVTYRNMTELRQALADVNADLPLPTGTVRTRRVVLTSRSGF